MLAREIIIVITLALFPGMLRIVILVAAGGIAGRLHSPMTSTIIAIISEVTGLQVFYFLPTDSIATSVQQPEQ